MLWRNDGPGCAGWCFTDVSASAGVDVVAQGAGLATGDYDNDGDLDFYVSNRRDSMILLQNLGGGRFADVGEGAGGAYHSGAAGGWGTAFFDFDNDGWLDLYLAASGSAPLNGDAGLHNAYADRLFRNQRDGSFRAVDNAPFSDAGYAAVGVSTADFDGDGRVDYLLRRWDSGHRLLRNISHAGAMNHWIAFELAGGGEIDRDALGTRVTVVTDDGLAQMRELKSGSSLGAGNELVLHFGLGAAEIKRVIVSWLNGELHEYTAVPLNRRCLITRERMDCPRRPQSAS